MTSVINSKKDDCPGLAPDAEIYVFKIFNSNQEQSTDWFLKAFDYAMELGVDIINLSNGGTNFLD